MARVKAFELFAMDLPFKKVFKHAAADRSTSYSLMLKCITASGHTGFGECLPRDYVTGETRDGTFELLQQHILPRLIGKDFDSVEHLKTFLIRCNGKAPEEWVAPAQPQTAAWAAVDLALLDAFGHAFDEPIRLSDHPGLDPKFKYSVVFSAEKGFKAFKTLVKIRLYGFRQAKLKIEKDTAIDTARLARQILGRKCDIRIDANMAWDISQAIEAMREMATYGIYSYEQPLEAHDIAGLAQLVKETGLGVMVDESFHDAESLEALINQNACTAVNTRISKNGGLMASYHRCMRALEAGMTVQVGCQVGETSLLSAAQMILIAAVRRVAFGEGCFGLHLLREDPVKPLMQFGYGGRPPEFPQGAGLGVTVDENMIKQWCVKKASVE